MPDFWTHILGGELILEKLTNQQWQNMIADNKKVFHFGCQGPDFFYYNDFWPWIKDKRGPQIGAKLHQENIKNSFISSMDYLKESSEQNFPLLATYLTGLIAHYAIDKTAHPFVYDNIEKPEDHKLLEINLDTYLMDKFWQKKAHRLSPKETIDLGKELPAKIENYYRKLLTEVHGYSQEELECITDSYQDYKQLLAIFYSPFQIKKQFLKLLNRFIPININVLIYPKKADYNLLSTDDYLNFTNILEQGVDEGVKLITTMQKYLQNGITTTELMAILPEISFDGKEITN